MILHLWGFPEGSAIKNPPAMQQTQEMRVWSLGWEDSLAGGNGNTSQYSCLENFMDRGAWQVTVHGVPELDLTELLSTYILPLWVCINYLFPQQCWIINNHTSDANKWINDIYLAHEFVGFRETVLNSAITVSACS